MDRLTERVDMTHEYEYGANGFCCTDAEQLIKVYDKLGRLEDIEDKLGVDIVRLYKALTRNIIYYKNEISNEIDECECVYSSITKYENNIYAFMLLIKKLNNEESYMVATIDYGKTWALTKEELEDDK